MDIAEISRVFSAHRMFANHPEPFRLKVLELFTQVGRARSVAKGTALFTAGAPNDGRAYLLLSGSLEVLKEGQPAILCEAPDLLGEMGQLHPMQKRMADVVTNEDCVVLAFEWPAFWEHVHEAHDPAFALEIEAFLGELAWTHLTE